MEKNKPGNQNNHKQRCHQIFLEAKKQPLYVFFESISENSDGSGSVILEIVTEDMLRYDSDVLNSLSLYPEYRPFFAWFRFSVDSTEFSDFQDRMGTWAEASFVSKKYLEQNVYEGYYEYSASPIKSIPALIKLNPAKLPQSEIDTIIRNYPCPSASDMDLISYQLKNVFTGVDLDKSLIYKVGNGNLISILGEKTGKPFSMLYDIGYHREGKPRKQYNSSIQALKTVHPDCIIISHWDFDHFKGVIYAGDDVFKCPWFAPEVDDKDGVNARRLISYINKRSKTEKCLNIWLIEKRNVETEIIKINNARSEIALYGGSGVGDNNNKRNSKGLVFSVINTVSNYVSVRSVFHGDVPYVAVSNHVWGFFQTIQRCMIIWLFHIMARRHLLITN